MRHSAFPVAVFLVENADLEPEVMKQQEYHCPFEERDIQPLEPPGAELPGIVEVLATEEIAGGNEEERHVLFVLFS